MKKELGDLKAKVSNAEGAAILLGQEYNGECKKLREFQAQFRAANDVRQDAYQYYLALKRQLHEKVCSSISSCISLFRMSKTKVKSINLRENFMKLHLQLHPSDFMLPSN